MPEAYKFLRLCALLGCALFLAAAMPAFEASALTTMDFYRAAQRYKAVNAFGAAIHCAHETGDWRSRLWRDGRNGAGIKANRAWVALGMPCIEVYSGEEIGGKSVAVRSSFRKYKTIDKFLRDYSRKVRDDYPLSARCYKNIWGYICGLYLGKNGRWATDGKYFQKLTKKAVQLAPEIYGPSWRKRLHSQLENARGFKILQKWQEDVILSALRGEEVL